MIIRKKELKDCEAWVDVNVNSWNDNLKEVVSDRLLKFIRDNRDLRIEKDINKFKMDDWNYVLEESNKVIGIMRLKPCDRVGFSDCGEVEMLYLYTDKKGNGYGKTLVNKAFEFFKAKGYKKVVIGCLDGNPSNGFYRHIGGKYVRQDSWDALDEHYMENVYEYEL